MNGQHNCDNMKMPNYWKIKPIKPIKVHFNIDTDRDKVFDFKDCQPFNHFKQDFDINDTSELEMSPEELKIYQDNAPKIAYHATDEQSAKVILKQGLKVGMPRKRGSLGGGGRFRRDMIYLTGVPGHATPQFGKVLLQVRIPNKRNIAPDIEMMGYPESYAYMMYDGNIPPNYISVYSAPKKVGTEVLYLNDAVIFTNGEIDIPCSFGEEGNINIHFWGGSSLSFQFGIFTRHRIVFKHVGMDNIYVENYKSKLSQLLNNAYNFINSKKFETTVSSVYREFLDKHVNVKIEGHLSKEILIESINIFLKEHGLRYLSEKNNMRMINYENRLMI